MGFGRAKGKSAVKGGKGGKGKGQWVLIPVQKSSFKKGASKGGRTGKGKKGRGKGKKPAKPFSELSEERKEQIRAKHEEVQAEQGRETVDDAMHKGELLQRGKKYGWIKPLNFAKLPQEVQAKVKSMVAAKRKTVKANDSDNKVFSQNVLFVHMSDVEEGVRVGAGDKVKFKVYVDNEGAGAYDVTTA